MRYTTTNCNTARRACSDGDENMLHILVKRGAAEAQRVNVMQVVNDILVELCDSYDLKSIARYKIINTNDILFLLLCTVFLRQKWA